MELPRRALAPALAAASVLAVGALMSRPPAPVAIEQRSPSGRVYKVERSSAVTFPGGGQGLGVRYVAESFEPARLAVEADEIMTLVSKGAEAGGLRVIVVEASRRRPLGLGSRTRSAAFGRQPDGVWRRLRPRGVAAPAAAPEDLLALDRAYARIERAVEAKDLSELRAVQAEDFWHRLINGEKRAREEENAALQISLKAVRRISPKLRISEADVDGSLAVVVASMTSTGVLEPSAGGIRFRSLTVSRDTWIKTSGEWRLAVSADVSDRFEPLGR